MLGGLTADQRRTGLDARLGDALDDLRDRLRDHLAGADVVGHEQRLGAADHQVVDDHADQVEPDRVVPVHLLRDRDLGPDAVGRRRQQRPPVRRQRGRVEQPGEPAEASDHLGTGRLGHPLLHQLDGPVPGLDVDSGGGVARALAHGVLLRRRDGVPEVRRTANLPAVARPLVGIRRSPRPRRCRARSRPPADHSLVRDWSTRAGAIIGVTTGGRARPRRRRHRRPRPGRRRR